VLLWIVGQIGTKELAATHVLMTLSLVAILPAMGFGIACASLVGHALGAKDPQDASRWGWNVAIMAALIGLAIGLPAALFREPILSLFLREPSTLALAMGPLLLSSLLIWFDAAGMTLFNAHLGAGDSKPVMVISIVCQWLIYLPLAYVLGPVMGYGLMMIWSLQVAYRLLQASLFAASWHRGQWSEVQV
jgi:Na+-driven multidrug efflux pump